MRSGRLRSPLSTSRSSLGTLLRATRVSRAWRNRWVAPSLPLRLSHDGLTLRGPLAAVLRPERSRGQGGVRKGVAGLATDPDARGRQAREPLPSRPTQDRQVDRYQPGQSALSSRSKPSFPRLTCSAPTLVWMLQKDPNAPAKPMSAFFLFMQAVREDLAFSSKVFKGVSDTAQQSKVAGDAWKKMSSKEKAVSNSTRQRTKNSACRL